MVVTALPSAVVVSEGLVVVLDLAHRAAAVTSEAVAVASAL
jgi:hypothetical protein